MSVTTKLMTWQEFMALPDDGQRHELVRGEVITMPPSETDHGIHANQINVPLGYFVMQNKLGTTLTGDAGYLLEADPDTVRAADLSFISKARLPTGKVGGGYFRGAPDFLVEMMSPSDTMAASEKKAREWIAGGARLVWVANPRRKSVTVHRPSVEPQTFREGDTLDAGDVVPGFTLPVADIFA